MIHAATLHATTSHEPQFAEDADRDYLDGESVCSRGKRKLLQYAGMGGGALFVLIPNSELIHSAFRAAAGASVGYQCC